MVQVSQRGRACLCSLSWCGWPVGMKTAGWSCVSHSTSLNTFGASLLWSSSVHAGRHLETFSRPGSSVHPDNASGHARGCSAQQGGSSSSGGLTLHPPEHVGRPPTKQGQSTPWSLRSPKMLGRREHPLVSGDRLCQESSYLLLGYQTQGGKKSWQVLGHECLFFPEHIIWSNKRYDPSLQILPLLCP